MCFLLLNFVKCVFTIFVGYGSQIAKARGPAGPNYEYLFRLEEALNDIGKSPLFSDSKRDIFILEHLYSNAMYHRRIIPSQQPSLCRALGFMFKMTLSTNHENML